MNDSYSGSDAASNPYSLDEKKNLIFYSSQLTNLTASLPKFKNDAVNREILVLKGYLNDFVYSIDEGNQSNLARSENNFEKSYKKIQKLRKFLNSEEDAVLSRYLVRIKINISQITGNLPKDSLSIPK